MSRILDPTNPEDDKHFASIRDLVSNSPNDLLIETKLVNGVYQSIKPENEKCQEDLTITEKPKEQDKLT